MLITLIQRTKCSPFWENMPARYTYGAMATAGLLLIALLLMFWGADADRPLLTIIGLSLLGVVMLGWVGAVLVLSLFLARDLSLLALRLLKFLYSFPKSHKKIETN